MVHQYHHFDSLMTNTSIRIDSEVRDRLKARERKGETYSEIIDQLLDETASDTPVEAGSE